MKTGNCLRLFIALLSPLFFSCMDYGPTEQELFDTGYVPSGDGVFIINEGNFTYGTASLSYYIPSTKTIQNEVFIRANGINLGDVAQSMSIYNGKGFIVVNNSGVVFVIDLNTFRVKGEIRGLTSPRYIYFLNESKAYITDLYDPRITVFNPATLEITGRIDMRGHVSTEQMVRYGNYIYTNCWSYDNKILVIDAQKDMLVDSIEVGIQPTSLVIDKNDKIWTITDGGYKGSPYGYEAPALYRIDAYSRKVEREFRFELGEHGSELAINGTRDTIYFIKGSVWKMCVDDQILPVRPFLEESGTVYYGLGVNPANSEVYVADAIDYSQNGIVYRFSAGGTPLDTMRVGITPGAFCFR